MNPIKMDAFTNLCVFVFSTFAQMLPFFVATQNVPSYYNLGSFPCLTLPVTIAGEVIHNAESVLGRLASLSFDALVRPVPFNSQFEWAIAKSVQCSSQTGCLSLS